MADVFFSYSSENREQVRIIHDALVADGFDVFWDQKVPPGKTWNTWIREQLEAARVVIVFWTKESVRSPNVIHEAMVAKQANKLVPAMLEDLPGTDLPMGFLTLEAAKLHDWAPGSQHSEWDNLLLEIAAKVMPPYASRRLAAAEAEIKSYRARAEHGTGREKALEAELRKATERENTLRNELQTARFENAQKAGGATGLSEAIKDAERKLASAEKERATLQARLVKAEATALAGKGKPPILSRVLAGIGIVAATIFGFQWTDTSSRLASVQSELWYLQSNPPNGDAALKQQLDDANARIATLQGEVDSLRSAAATPAITLPSVSNSNTLFDPFAGMTADQINARGDDYYFGNNGFTQDKTEAVRWYRKAVELGYAAAHYNLGYMYEIGEGGLAVDLYEAGRLYMAGANLGDVHGLSSTGRFYQSGLGGFTQSDTDAVSYYQRAVDLGDRVAMYAIASFYDAGTGGLYKDSTYAARLAVASLKRGYTHARDRLKEGGYSWSTDFRIAFQQQLQTTGHYSGPIDGNFGPGTQTAIDAIFSTDFFATP